MIFLLLDFREMVWATWPFSGPVEGRVGTGFARFLVWVRCSFGYGVTVVAVVTTYSLRPVREMGAVQAGALLLLECRIMRPGLTIILVSARRASGLAHGTYIGFRLG